MEKLIVIIQSEEGKILSQSDPVPQAIVTLIDHKSGGFNVHSFVNDNNIVRHLGLYEIFIWWAVLIPIYLRRLAIPPFIRSELDQVVFPALRDIARRLILFGKEKRKARPMKKILEMVFSNFSLN